MRSRASMVREHTIRPQLAGTDVMRRNLMSRRYAVLFRQAAHQRLLLLFTIVFIGLTPSLARACACGCGVFEVATPSLLPMGAGAMTWIEYDFMNQYINWHATQPASGSYNNDKKLATN